MAAARARVTEAEARLADAKQQMQRPSEIEVLEASLAQAKAMVNVELAKWVNGPVPGDWADWRQLWEWGQAANGLAQFGGFAALIASVLVMKVKKDKTAKTWG